MEYLTNPVRLFNLLKFHWTKCLATQKYIFYCEKREKKKADWEHIDSIPLNSNQTTASIQLGENQFAIATKELAKMLDFPGWK